MRALVNSKKCNKLHLKLTEFEKLLFNDSQQIKGLISKIYSLLLNGNKQDLLHYQRAWHQDLEEVLDEDQWA